MENIDRMLQQMEIDEEMARQEDEMGELAALVMSQLLSLTDDQGRPFPDAQLYRRTVEQINELRGQPGERTQEELRRLRQLTRRSRIIADRLKDAVNEQSQEAFRSSRADRERDRDIEEEKEEIDREIGEIELTVFGDAPDFAVYEGETDGTLSGESGGEPDDRRLLEFPLAIEQLQMMLEDPTMLGRIGSTFYPGSAGGA